MNIIHHNYSLSEPNYNYLDVIRKSFDHVFNTVKNSYSDDESTSILCLYSICIVSYIHSFMRISNNLCGGMPKL